MDGKRYTPFLNLTLSDVQYQYIFFLPTSPFYFNLVPKIFKILTDFKNSDENPFFETN